MTGYLPPGERDQAPLPDAEAFAARLRVLYQQTPVAVGATLINSGLVALVLAPSRGALPVLIWFALTLALAAVRLLLWRLERRKPSSAGPERWARRATAAAAASGLLWGVGGALLFPDTIVLQTFLAFVIGGMCAGAVVAFSAHLPTLLAFVVAASLPMALRFLIEGTGTYAAMALMIVVFAGALAIVGRNVSRAVHAEFVVRAALAARTEELSRANARLERESRERQLTEERLLQSQKLEALGQLTGGIAHDFNNLLTVVIGNIELALPLGAGNAKLVRWLNGALAGARHGAALTRRLLAFARRQHLKPESIDLRALAKSFSAMATQTLGPLCRLSVEVAPEVWRVRADRGQLELALLNLAINARDAMPEGGELRISIENRPAGAAHPAELAPGDYIVIRVADSGIGMSPEVRARAFDPFFTTKEPGRGSGLGLPMVLGFALQSGGSVQIDSAPGRGTEIELWLPRASAGEGAAEAGSSADARAPAAPAGERILLCEDDAEMRQFVAEVLREAGYAVAEAAGPREALALLEQERPGLLLSDYAMPGMNGAALIGEAQRRWPGLKALLMSGHADALVGPAKGAISFLPKPFGPADLRRRIAEILKEPAL